KPMTFAKGASAYKTYLESPHGRLRLEIAWHQLSRFTTESWGVKPGPRCVLDIGCGTGELPLRLAAQGHSVTLIDPAEEMLYLAKEKAAALDPPSAFAPQFLRGSLEEAAELVEKKTFDLVLCHMLVEYLPDPSSSLVLLRPLLRPDGFLSLITVNRCQEPFRLGIRDRKFEEAMRALVGKAPMDSLFGLPRSGMVSNELEAQLEGVGINVLAHQGIFVFSDYVPTGTLEDPSNFTALLRLETQAGILSPFKEVARYLHLWGRRAE
ncbi:MAG: class I SAM-dependent methyltransferase, partial [Candidatus Methylomirabilales bacterium]